MHIGNDSAFRVQSRRLVCSRVRLRVVHLGKVDLMTNNAWTDVLTRSLDVTGYVQSVLHPRACRYFIIRSGFHNSHAPPRGADTSNAPVT